MKVNTSNNNYSVRVGAEANLNSSFTGNIAPRKFIQLTDVNMIGVANGDLVAYDEASKTFVPRSSLSVDFPDEINILYVSKTGNDANSGKAIQEAKLTIESAVGIASEGTVIKIAPGNYIVNNPITLPDQVSIIGDGIREVSIGCSNSGDLFYVGNGNYIAEMSFTGIANSGAIFSFDPNQIRYINQSPYIQNCTNFIPNSIGMKIDGNKAIGPIKSMVLDSYTQYNQGGIGVSITNEGYAQLVSLFTICNNIAVYCGSGGACDLTNSNSSFGNYGLIADGLSPLKYIGITTGTSTVNSDEFTIQFENSELQISDAIYDNITGYLTAYTETPHHFSVGMGVSLSGLGFTCTYEPGVLIYPSGNKGYVFEVKTVAPGRYLDSYNLIQANRQEIIDTSYNQILNIFPPYINPNPVKCKRDLGYFVDAISLDVRDFTNAKSINFIKSYFNNGTLIENGLLGEETQSIVAFNKARDLMKLAITNNLTIKNLDLEVDPDTNSNTDPISCANIRTFIDNLVSIIITPISSGNLFSLPLVSMNSNIFTVNVGISTLAHTYNSGGTAKLNISRPFDGQVVYFNELYYTVNKVQISSGGSGYTNTPYVTIDPPTTSWGIPAQAVAIVRNGSIVGLELVSSGRGYTTIPNIIISSPNVGLNTAVASLELTPTYYSIQSSTAISSGICTITLNDNVPYSIENGVRAYFYKQSRILASGHSLEYIGSGTEITTALPASGGVSIQENETDSRNGGLVVYTSTDQSGNFRIGDGVLINQQTGNISGRSYSKSLFSQMTPYIIALGGD